MPGVVDPESKPVGPQTSTTVRGAEPAWPPLSKPEQIAEIERASGSATPLRDLRAVLPAARTRRTKRDAAREAAAPEPSTSGAAAAVRGAAAGLSIQQRETVIDQAQRMLEDLYAHLPLKRALHAIDPIQRLRLLRLRQRDLDEREFHSEMIDIFVSLRDLHTNYVLPSAYQPKYAFLPFRVEEYYDGDDRKYLVSAVSPLNTDEHLVPGVEITHWSGMPIDLAVARNASREAGSNPEARRARGLEALTLRWLGMSLPPDEDWVTLTYRDDRGATRESRIAWSVIEPDPAAMTPEASAHGSSESRSAMGIDVQTELLRRARKRLFNAAALKTDDEMARMRRIGEEGKSATVSVMPDVYPRFGPVETPSGTFGYIRLATFAPPQGDVNGAVKEFVRLLKLMPLAGLILDVRGNGGGYVNFGERLLQTLTPQPITPEPFHFVSTALTLEIAQTEKWLSEWATPLATALSTGAGFSQGFPITTPASCNDIGQIYQGPVVLVTDAFCYSTTDIFTAGFQDHGIGKILGCHDNTGAGGANVWDYELLEQLSLAPNPFGPLPGGTGMRVAARRSTRVGERSGVPLEDLGVVPDERHFMTRNDLLKGNVDLIAHAAKLLKKQPSQTLTVTAAGHAPTTEVEINATNIDRVDLLVDGRPVESVDVAAAPTKVKLSKPLTGHRLVAEGYRKNQLVASARLS